MLIILIIGFELKGSGPPGLHVRLQLFTFMTKQKSLRKIFEWIIKYLLLTYCTSNVTCFLYLSQITNQI